jgi:hypothetical protein
MRRLTAIAFSMLLVLAMAPGAVAKEHGTDRPIWTNVSGEVRFLYDWADPSCPVRTLSDSYGTMSHLGEVWLHWSHCPPVTQPLYTDHHVTITAANGDTLIGTYDINGEAPYYMDITGGTGRFAGATGRLAFAFQLQGEWGPDELPIQPWYGWWQLKGVISY